MVNLSGDALAQANGLFEPQRQNNWLFTVIDTIPGAELLSGESLHIALETFNLPSITVEEVELNYQNVKRYVSGKATYETTTLAVKDMVDVGIASAFEAWMKLVYDPETDAGGLAKNYKKLCEATLFAPDGSAERIWQFIGCWPQQVNFGSLDMSSSDKVNIEVTLRYDKAKRVQ